MSSNSAKQRRSALRARLQARRADIEEAALTRIYAIEDPTEAANPVYLQGLRATVTAAIEYGIAAVELAEKRAPPIPAALLEQARVAARSGVSLDTVMRRYLAGYTLLGDFLIEEAGQSNRDGAELKPVLRSLAVVFDRLIGVVSAEYASEAKSRPSSAEQRRAEFVKRLLDGELVDLSEISYEFDCEHLGAIATGPGAEEALRKLSATLDRRLMVVRPDETSVWAWLGARHPLDSERLEGLLHDSWPRQLSLTLGERGEGLAGWRLSHRQAAAALPIALRSSRPFVRYADVALLTTILQDDLFATSLRQLYLAPLESDRDGGRTAKETLRAYFAAGCNASSAAASLGVSRRTVANRLQVIDERLGRSPDSVSAEIDAALRLDEFSDISRKTHIPRNN